MRHQANGVRYWDRQKVHKKQAYPGNKVFTILTSPTPSRGSGLPAWTADDVTDAKIFIT